MENVEVEPGPAQSCLDVCCGVTPRGTVSCLDIGCGVTPRGTVNLDLMVENADAGMPVHTGKIPNFVRADAQALPFKTDTFQRTVCFHTLEHLAQPAAALKEMVRVSTTKIVFSVPHIYFEVLGNLFRPGRKEWRRKHHKHRFTVGAVRQLMAEAGLRNYRLKCRFVDLLAAVKHRAVYDWLIPIPVPFDILVVVDL